MVITASSSKYMAAYLAIIVFQLLLKLARAAPNIVREQVFPTLMQMQSLLR